MNTASLELCKELYKVSGWKADYWYDWNHGEPTVEDMKLSEFNIPAYDLGYLLRKLPRFIEEETMHYWLNLAPDAETEWFATYDYYDASPKGIAGGYKATPEDALVELAIELFKQGILK